MEKCGETERGGAAQLGIVTGLERLVLALVPFALSLRGKLAAKVPRGAVKPSMKRIPRGPACE